MVQAFNDLNAAWTANNPTNNPAPSTPLTPPLPASPLPAGGTFSNAGQDLSGLLLGPGIYASVTPTDTLALSNTIGPLVLDAGGNPDAVFIFQAHDITTTTGSVILRNGALAKNVYWVLTATATIGTDTVFQGNILAGTTVTVGVGASVEGRVLAGATKTSGALTINGGIITTP
jgi:type VI secretion system secreted protein VgrG